jgi:hypothetical protein
MSIYHEVKPITVADLIAHLQTLPQGLLVTHRAYSEMALLELKDVKVNTGQPPRADGWVHDARPDKPTQAYVAILGF